MTNLRYARSSFSSVRTVILLIHSSSFERLMHATVMCMHGVHNEPIFTTIEGSAASWTLVLFAHQDIGYGNGRNGFFLEVIPLMFAVLPVLFFCVACESVETPTGDCTSFVESVVLAISCHLSVMRQDILHTRFRFPIPCSSPHLCLRHAR